MLISRDHIGLQLYYYRQPIGTNTNPIQSWKVEGLATRITQGVFSDNLDCNTTSNNGAGISWTGQVPFSSSWVQSLLNGKRLALDSFNNINFGIYTCYDSATNESLNVNITSGERWSNAHIISLSDTNVGTALYPCMKQSKCNKLRIIE